MPGPDTSRSAVPAPALRCVFCGITPGRVSAAAAAHFANPRNDFWRLLHASGFTPRLYDPTEQFALLELGIGVTNARDAPTPAPRGSSAPPARAPPPTPPGGSGRPRAPGARASPPSSGKGRPGVVRYPAF